MKVLLVNGSPHKNDCTYTALRAVGDSLERNGVGTELFWIGTKPIGGCIGCHQCAKRNQCVFEDKVNEFLAIAGDYDGYVFGTPVHWGAAAGNMTSFLDRVFYADLNAGGDRFRLKPAAAVVSARRAGTTATWDQINKYFALMQMPIISSRYWTAVHGAAPEQVLEDKEGGTRTGGIYQLHPLKTRDQEVFPWNTLLCPTASRCPSWATASTRSPTRNAPAA